jgi:hypothetical protein
VVLVGASTTLVLSATAISLGNEWLNTGEVNWRIPIAGIGTALIFDLIETVDPQIGKGLAVLMFISVMVTPFKGKSPAETAAHLLDTGTTKVTGR